MIEFHGIDDDIPPPSDLDGPAPHRRLDSPRDAIPPPLDVDVPAVRGRDFDARGFARLFLASRGAHPDGVTVRRWRGDWYRWDRARGAYSALTDDRLDVDLYNALPVDKRSEVSEVKLAVMAAAGVLIDEHEIGTWLDGPPPDGVGQLETIACRNGLVHLPTGRLDHATPRYFSTTTFPIVYDPAAPAPRIWFAFLRQLWPQDEDTIAFLQEWIGYLLTPDTRHHKIAMLIGKPRSGKGTVGRMVTELLGKENVAGPTLGQFGTNFGMQPLIGKLAAVVGDARLSGRTDTGPILERLLQTSGADPQTVDRKNRDAWYGILPTRLTIISNEIPRLMDASTALTDRSIFVRFSNSFLGKEDIDLSAKLRTELPGILLWAIDGWRRLRARGRFDPPATGRKMAEQMADQASPIGAWLRRRCVVGDVGREHSIDCTKAFEDYKAWCTENGQQHVASMTRFGTDIDTITGCQRVRLSPQAGGSRPYVYEGLRLKTPLEDLADDN